ITPLQDWASTIGSQNFYVKNVTKTFGSFIYVVGGTLSSTGTYDMLLAKYNTSGVLQWEKQYDGAAHYQDVATSVYVDNGGNVFICGVVTNDSVYHTSDVITIKYNSSGTQQWVATYNGTGSLNDGASDIIVDASGGVYVSGSSYNASGNTDMIAIKYNSSGTQQWVGRYDGSSHLNDAATRVALNGTNCAISGAIQTGTTVYEYGVITYNQTTGAQTGATITTSGTSGIAEVTGLVKDASGNIYICGDQTISGHGLDYTVIKVTPAMVISWTANYNGSASLDDVANAIEVDGSGNVFVTGSSKTTSHGKDYVTLKYNSSGTLQWTQTYNDSLNGDDEATAMAIDVSGNIYVTGSAKTDSLNLLNYYTIKYNTSGTQLWNIVTDGNAHFDDKPSDIAVDTLGQIYVSGESGLTSSTYQYLTVRYLEKNIITPTDYNSETAQTGFNYYENKGQLINDAGSLIPTERFYCKYQSPTLYFTDNSMSLVFAHIDTVHTTSDTIHRIDMTFTQVSSHAKTYALETQADFNNYYLAHCSQGVTEIHSNKRLITSDLYPNIDLEYSSNQNGFKYYFVIKPGGDPTSIKMVYTGASSFSLNGTTNELTVNSAVGSITYDRPTVYQVNSSNVVVPITGWTADWQTDGASNKYKFNIGAYDNTKALIIEVDRGNAAACTGANSYKNIRLSSYYGGTYWDMQNAATVGSTNVYYAGYSADPSFPHTTTPSTINGDNTAVCSKFNNYGAKSWSVFYGGTQSDIGYGICVNPSGFPVMVGVTGSSDLIISHTGHQYTQTFGGVGDGFLVRFNPGMGTMNYSTYFGGSGYEGLNKVKTIVSGSNTYMYVAGYGDQNSPHVTKSGAYNSGTSSGNKGLIASFDQNDSLVWSTFIGDNIRALATDNNSMIGIGGFVYAQTLPYKKATAGGYLDSTFNTGGGYDAFIGIINFPTDDIKWLTYYGGSKSDLCNSLAFDSGIEGAYPSLYATGITGSLGNTTNDFDTYNPGGWSYYGGTYHGDGDAVMWKFSSTGVRLWASYYGKSSGMANKDDSGNDVIVDSYNNVYFCGESASHTLESNNFGTYDWYNQAYASVTNDYQSFLFMVDGKNLQLFWATRFGGNSGESAAGLAYDYYGKYLYLTGTTYTASNGVGFPAYRPSTYVSPPGWYVCQHQPTVSEGDGYFAQFNIANGVATGITEHQSNDNGLISFPNPFGNEITFNFSVEDSKGYTIEIYNTLGQIVFTQKDQTSIGQISKTVDLGFINTGIYFVQVKLSNRILASKIVRQ
ncbi:MAG: DUF7948 domain-containing protein, partial [Bacteroidia bacterium]